MNQFERHIYNTFLKVSRSSQNLPFKYRKDFDGFEDDPKYGYIKKLGTFFGKFSHISVDDFFRAPYEIYPDGYGDYHDLKFYISPRAIRMYGSYQKKKDNESPDSKSQTTFIINSLMFIFLFCKEHNIQLNEYLVHTSSGDLYTFIDHLRQRKVSLYTFFGFPDFENRLHEYPKSRLEFTLGEEFIKELASRKLLYYNSTKAKCMAQDGLDKIKNLLHKLKK